MDAGVAPDDAPLVVMVRVDLWQLPDRLDHSAHKERQDREARPISFFNVEFGAEILESGDVNLLDIGDVRDPRLGERHLVGNAPAKADDLDLLDLGAALEAGGGQHT